MCICVCKNIRIYIVDAETPGYLYFYSDYVCIQVVYEIRYVPWDLFLVEVHPPRGIHNW